MSGSKPTPFEIAYFVEHHMRSKHADNVEHGPTRHLVPSTDKGLQTWLTDPSRYDFPYVDTKERREPSKGYKKKIPIIKHYIHTHYEGILEDTYWQHHKKNMREDRY